MTYSFEEEKNIKILEKLDYILDNQLPEYCQDYFIGIEHRTTALTRLNYAYDIKLFLQFLCNKIQRFKNRLPIDILLSDIEYLSSFEIEIYLNWLNKYKDINTGKTITNSEAGKKRKLSSLRAFIKYFVKKHVISIDPTTSVDMPKIRTKDIVRLEQNEIIDMLDVVQSCNGMSSRQQKYLDNTKNRDTAIVNFLLATGIRVSELVGMDMDDIDFNNLNFVVTRKGGARVILYMPEDVAGIIMDYYLERKAIGKKCPNESALFLSLQNKRISTRSVENIVKKYSAISTPLKNISPHKLRSTFGTQLYRATGDIYIVADVLGHKDVNTTKKHYAAISDDIRRNASTKVNWLTEEDQEDY